MLRPNIPASAHLQRTAALQLAPEAAFRRPVTRCRVSVRSEPVTVASSNLPLASAGT